jgi:hypothetical protein
VIRKVLRGIKSQRLFVYMFVAVAVLGIAVTSTLTSDPSASMASSSTVSTVSNSATAATAYQTSLSSAMQSAGINESGAAASASYNSVPDLAASVNGGSNGLQGLSYFTFARWSTVTLLPVPAVGFANIGSLVVAAFVSLANLMFTVGAIVLLAIGLLMILITSLDLLSSFMPTIDWFFSQLAGSWLTSSAGTSGALSGASPFFIAIALFAVATAVRLSPLARKDSSLLGDLVISGGAIAALMFISSASSKNWDNSSRYQVDALNGSTNTIPFGKGASANVDVDTGDWKSYAPWSFGSGLTLASDAVNQVVNIAGGVISTISTSIGNVASGNSTSNVTTGSDCSRYVTNGMHPVAERMLKGNAFNGIADTSVRSIMSYDNLVFRVLYKPAAEASYGSTASGEASWCRMWESARGSDPVEQAYLSREAGLYNYALNNGNNGIFLNADGSFKNGEEGKSQLAGFFGTNLATAKGTTAFKFYWAACAFDGNNLRVSNAFEGTKGTKVDDDDKPSGETGDDLTNENCQKVLQINDDTGGWAFGAKNNNDSATGGILGGDPMDLLSPFAWTTDDEVFTLFFIGFSVPANTSAQLANDDVTTTEAIDFFKMTYGSASGMVWPAAIVAVVGTVMMSVGLLPMQLGALILQMISVLALIAFPAVLLVLILPIRAGRRALATVGKLFLSSKMVQLIFVAFIAIAIAIINLLSIAFDSVLNSSVLNVSAFTGDGTPLGTFVTAILNAVAIGVAFYGTKKLLRDVFKADVTTVRGAMSVGQNMASSAVNGGSMREMGFGQLKGMRPQPSFGNTNLPDGLGKNTADDKEPRQPDMPQRAEENKETAEDPNTKKDTADAVKDAAVAAGVAGAAGTGPSNGNGDLPPVAADSATGGLPAGAAGSLIETPGVMAKTTPGTIGDGMNKNQTDGPNGANPEAPVANDALLTAQQRQEAAEKSEAVRSQAGIPAEDVTREINSRSTADLERQMDEGEFNGDEEMVRGAVGAMGAGAATQLEGAPAETAENENARRGFFDNAITNEELPNEKGEQTGEANVKAIALERIQREAGEQSQGVGGIQSGEGVALSNGVGQEADNAEATGAGVAGGAFAGVTNITNNDNTTNTTNNGSAEGSRIGSVDNNDARSENLRAAVGSEFEAPGMAEDVSTAGLSNGGNYAAAGFEGSEGLTRAMSNLPGEIGSSVRSAMSEVMEPSFERFDALGRSIQHSVADQSDSLRQTTSEQRDIAEMQVASMENLQRTIANWFPGRNTGQ